MPIFFSRPWITVFERPKCSASSLSVLRWLNRRSASSLRSTIGVFHWVMLDSDLAKLYEVETKALNQAVRRNLDRFPKDFMFQLTNDEYESLRCQNGTSNDGRGGRRYLPLVFTEGGVAMLSSVLTSERAALINISIIRTFIKLRN